MVRNGRTLSFERSALGWLILFAQFALPVTASFFPVLAADVNPARNNAPHFPENPAVVSETIFASDNEKVLANQAQVAGGLLSQQNSRQAALNMGRSILFNQINDTTQGWFNQFGTARLQLNPDDSFRFNGSAFDFLMPLYEKEDIYYYSQLGLRRLDHRTTSNLGLGVRRFENRWMYGLNVFFDNDITGKNRRFGAGGETAADYIKLSTNGYFRLSKWHPSRDFFEYNERPANGFDVRMNVFLPFYPHLGGNMIYERYKGKNVALFNKNKRQKNPWAFTSGVSYTPFSLLTLGVNHKQGKEKTTDTSVHLQMNYRLGEPWRTQVDTTAVSQWRTLAGSRYDLVDRNNSIILEYQRRELIKLALPTALQGTAGDSITLTANVKSTYGLEAIEWDTSQIMAAGGEITPVSPHALKIVIPPYRFRLGEEINTYAISAVARDYRGNLSERAFTTVNVMAPKAQMNSLEAIKNGALANNRDVNIVRAIVTDSQGIAQAAQRVAFTAEKGATLSAAEVITDKNGVAEVNVTSTNAGISQLVAEVGGSQKHIDITFIADRATARINEGDLILIQDNALANGSALNKIQAGVKDAYDNPVPGLKVTFTATEGAMFTHDTVETDAQGVAQTSLYSRKAVKSEVTGMVNQSRQQVVTTFVPDDGSAVLTTDSVKVIADGAVANNRATNKVHALVTDAHGNVLAGYKVTFVSTNDSQLSSSIVATNSQGIAEVTLTNTRAGVSMVTVKVDGSERSVNTTFIPDESTAKIDAGDLQIIRNNAVANGVASNEVLARVTDAWNNPVADISVAFSADNGGVLSSGRVKTNVEGKAVVTVSSTRAGKITIGATVNASWRQVSPTFVADSSTAKLAALTVIMGEALADGSDKNEVRAQIVDTHGNPIAGQRVNFSATSGAVIAASSISDEQGWATASLTSTVGAQSVVTATFNGTSQQVTILFVEITGVRAGGYTFMPDAGFPQTALSNASFQIQLNGGTGINSNFDWSSSLQQVTVNATGSVTFASAVPVNVPVTISARSRQTGKISRYTFTLRHWIAVLDKTHVSQSTANQICRLAGMSLISKDIATQGQSIRAVGTLWGEWGYLSSLPSPYFWVSEYNYHVHTNNGWYHGGDAWGAVCVS